jgi:hypothetical protein
LVGGGVGVERAACDTREQAEFGRALCGRRGAGEIYACCCGVLAGPAGQMGFLSAKLLPSCESMCVCCPALRPSSRRPVKRYKKLLAEIFPKTPDGAPNERKIMKLCEYAAKNPLRIPKIAKFLEQRTHKELRAAHLSFVRIITEAYSKLLFICKEQMAYFAISLVNVLTELLESKQENIHILGCQTLANFINSQVDNTYARNIESLVRKVCALSHQQGEEHRLLRAASLQCLSEMIWFMKEHSYIFADFDESHSGVALSAVLHQVLSTISGCKI